MHTYRYTRSEHDQTLGVLRNFNYSRQLTPFPITNAPTKMRPMLTTKISVATTRTGLNILIADVESHRTEDTHVRLTCLTWLPNCGVS